MRRCKLTILKDGAVDADLDVLAHQITENLRARLQSEPEDTDDDEGADEDEGAGDDKGNRYQPATGSPGPSWVNSAIDAPSADSEVEQSVPADDAGDGADEDEDEEELVGDLRTEVELGQSVLGKLAELLEDREWVSEHEELVRDLAKPATIIDGQHRVLGAAKCERMIPFAVCALIDCSWPEQVFQFTVVNYTATGIPDQFITANAALSLTGSELRGLETRLVQAGVKVVEYELMRVVNFDDRSSFFELVNLAERKDSSKIGYKTMVRIANMWHRGKTPVISASLLPNLYPDIKGNRRTYRRESLTRWQDKDWGEFFIAFWDAVRAVYDRCNSHEPGHQTAGTSGTPSS